jgi:hypothetical protein
MLHNLQVGSDEAQDRARANPGVHTGLSSRSATLAPRNKTNESTAVALARVLAALSEAGAEHVGRDGT